MNWPFQAVARHWQRKTARFSQLIDEYPNRTETAPVSNLAAKVQIVFDIPK